MDAFQSHIILNTLLYIQFLIGGGSKIFMKWSILSISVNFDYNTLKEFSHFLKKFKTALLRTKN